MIVMSHQECGDILQFTFEASSNYSHDGMSKKDSGGLSDGIFCCNLRSRTVAISIQCSQQSSDASLNEYRGALSGCDCILILIYSTFASATTFAVTTSAVSLDLSGISVVPSLGWHEPGRKRG